MAKKLEIFEKKVNFVYNDCKGVWICVKCRGCLAFIGLWNHWIKGSYIYDLWSWNISCELFVRCMQHYVCTNIERWNYLRAREKEHRYYFPFMIILSRKSFGEKLHQIAWNFSSRIWRSLSLVSSPRATR